MEPNLLKRPFPETHSPEEPVSNKRRSVAFGPVRCPFDDEDSVFREFLEQQHLPLYPDVIYLSDSDEDEPEEEPEEGEFDQQHLLPCPNFVHLSDEDHPEEEPEEEEELCTPRLDPLFTDDRDSIPSLIPTRLNIEPDFGQRPSVVSVFVDAECGRDGVSRFPRPTLFGEDHLTAKRQQSRHYSTDHSRCSKRFSGLASIRSWSRLFAPSVAAHKMVSETESDANDVPALATGGAVALELAFLNFPEDCRRGTFQGKSDNHLKNRKFDVVRDFPPGCGHQRSCRIFQGKSDNYLKNRKFDVVRDFPPGCGHREWRLAGTEAQFVEVVEDNFS
ncbi:hypothetical protein CDL15_Pgr020901 [Punica granatum]|uniref:Uncharacterized protein n=1 Tax=Punica granatum TaxID=22663 RepID=A0A218XV80_PUNGR|nr:hypothetical protein CDL15_Pgr020901 [Punica granatum]PKI78086.1 hypothetical protein CRG98_001536 [Punica granatum]